MANAQIQIARGDIVVVDLQGAVGGEKKNDGTSGARPCVVVQNDGGNKGSPLTIVAPLTDMAQYKGYPQQVKVTAAQVKAIGPTAKDSIVECGHLRSIDRAARIKKNCGPIDPTVLPQIDTALKASLGLK
jgi:mRNA interferase MazF